MLRRGSSEAGKAAMADGDARAAGDRLQQPGDFGFAAAKRMSRGRTLAKDAQVEIAGSGFQRLRPNQNALGMRSMPIRS